MDKVFHKKDLTPKGPPLAGRSAPSAPGPSPTRHKEFNEFIKRKGFKGSNNYKLTDLKAMSAFKPIITGFPVTISSDQLEPTRFDSM